MFLEKIPNAGLLRYELLPGETIDEFTLEVLRQDPPKGVLLLGREQTDAWDHLLLPVAPLIPFDEIKSIVKNPITYDKVLERVQEVSVSLSNHMIPQEFLVLRPEWTFADPETMEPVFLVLPTSMAKDLSLSLEDFMVLVRQRFQETPVSPSAKPSAKVADPPKPLREIFRDFWESLA